MKSCLTNEQTNERLQKLELEIKEYNHLKDAMQIIKDKFINLRRDDELHGGRGASPRVAARTKLSDAAPGGRVRDPAVRSQAPQDRADSPTASLFLPLAQAVLSSADEAVRVLRDHRGVTGGEVRIGCNPSVASLPRPRLARRIPEGLPRRASRDHRGRRPRAAARRAGRLPGFRGRDRARSRRDSRRHTARERGPARASPPRSSFRRPHLHSISPSFVGGFRAPHPFATTSRSNSSTPAGGPASSRGWLYQAGSIEAVKNLVRRGLGVSILPSRLAGAGPPGKA